MKVKELLMEGMSKKDTFATLHEFVRFAAEHLELNSLPKFDFVFDSERSVTNKSFGGYGQEHIIITVKNRHIMDVCRTLAHELVHYRQDLNGDLDKMEDPGADGSPIENEANAEAAVIMRKWGKLHPNLFAQDSVE
jgi:Zn-dependent peptidase ImmA (M78 family)